jgi:hypothetical protein
MIVSERRIAKLQDELVGRELKLSDDRRRNWINFERSEDVVKPKHATFIVRIRSLSVYAVRI